MPMSESPLQTSRSAEDALLLKKEPLSSLPPIVGGIVKAKIKESKHNPHLVISITDMNNQNGSDISNCNPEKNALHIGLSWNF